MTMSMGGWQSFLAGAWVMLGGSGALAAAGLPVTAELMIAPAAIHVIGDPTLLYWEFHNRSAEPLAFLWEGCCRLNGRLQVTAADGSPVDLVPPGQALAHMFARAERLEPGLKARYDTRLADWVRLVHSGSYTLKGRYTGVLPDQQPQVPKGLRLWREAAATPPIQVSVLSVDDYLAQREDRSRRRGLELRLRGAATLPPLEASPFTLEIRNTAEDTRAFDWPDDMQLWVVGPDGQRLANIATDLEGAHEAIALPAGRTHQREIRFDSTRLEGAAFGEYRAFVDLAATPDQPRVPSDTVRFRWELTDGDVARLIDQASRGSRVGLRNAPLKLLRVYLGGIESSLERAAALAPSPAATALARQLRLASRLKQLAPRPGRVDWPLHVEPGGRWSFGDPGLAACAEEVGGPTTNGLAALLRLRRHLGWEVGLTLDPAPEATLADLVALAGALPALATELAGPVRVGSVRGLTNSQASLTIRLEPLLATRVIRLEKVGGDLRLSGALAPGGLTDLGVLRRLVFEALGNEEALRQWLARTPPGETLVTAAPSLTWSDLAMRLAPLLQSGASASLVPWG